MVEYCQIELTRGQVVRVSPEDFDELARSNWYARWDKSAKKFYAGRNTMKKTILMHRAVTSCPLGLLVDHINGDTLDNRRENLRFATAAENGRNRGPNRSNSTGYKGVTLRNGRFVASIMVNRKVIFIGSFVAAYDAHLAYAEASKKHHGEFAKAA